MHLLINLVDIEKEKALKKIEEDDKKNKEAEKEKTNNNKNSDDIKKDIKSKKDIKEKNNIKKAKIAEEEDIKILRQKNIVRISNFLKEFMESQQIKEIKRTNSMINLRPHSHTITSETTCDDSIIEETLNINQIIENNEKKGFNKKADCHNTNNEILNFNQKEEKDEKNEKNNFSRAMLRSKTVKSIVIEMEPTYREEKEEKDTFNIVYKMPENKLISISPNILLKKIIFEDFMNSNALLIYHFCQQCFSFIKKEIFFNKIFNCYKFYRDKKITIDKLQNLIDFINILIIEMFEYYQTIDFNETHFNLIKKFYNELIVDLITNNIKEEEECENNNNNENKLSFYKFEKKDNCNTIETIEIQNSNTNNNISNKKELINVNLNTDINNINIFIFKKKDDIQNNQNKVQIKSNLKKKKDKKDNKKDKINTLRAPSKSICFKDNISPILEMQKEDEKKKIEEVKKSNSEEIKEQQKSFQISKTIRNSRIISEVDILKIMIPEEVGKEDNSDDEKKIKNIKSSKSSNSGSDSDSDNDFEDIIILNQKTKEKEEEKLKTINNLIQNTLSSEKLLTKKEELFYKLQFIFLLLDCKIQEKNSIIDVKNIKLNFSFYEKIQNLIKKQKKKNLLHVSSTKRLTKVGNNLYFDTLNKLNTNIPREYLSKGYFCITDWKTEEIGDKLLLVSKSFLNKIKRKELYRGIFLKKNKETTSPNVVASINSFNRLTSFIIEDIISYNSPRDRAKIYDKWLQVANYCKSNRDYNDLIAIYSALNHYVITGLKLTFKEMKSKTKNLFEQINNFCTIEGNYKNIREDMISCQKKGITYLPYLGMLLRDINFHEESSKYINEYGCINMEKIEKINTIIEEFFSYKASEKAINEKHKAIVELKFFEKLEDITEEKLEEIANKIEPELKFNNQTTKRLTNIDKLYFEEYKDIFNSRKYMKRSTVVGNFRNSLVPGRAKSTAFPFDKNFEK